jgi:hypothetical protein
MRPIENRVGVEDVQVVQRKSLRSIEIDLLLPRKNKRLIALKNGGWITQTIQ